MFNSAEIIFYDENEDAFGFDLTPTQVVAICKVLGIKYNANNKLTCYSDETILKLCDSDKNPLNAKIIVNEN